MEVLLASPWIPTEWIKAHKLQPRVIWPTLPTRSLVAAGACAFARAFLQKARSEPHTAFVFASSCDQMRRAWDEMGPGEHSRVFLFNLPSTWQSQTAREMYVSEVERLGRFLVRLGGETPAGEDLAAVMAESGRTRELLLALRPGLSSAAWARAIHQYHWDGTMPSSSTTPVEDQPRTNLAIVGGPMSPEHWEILETVESAGGRIVLNGTEPGERTLLPPFPQPHPGDNPAAVLCQHYFDHIIDVYQRPNTRLYAWLESHLKAREARGIILWHHYGCDLWRAEAATLRETFGLPVLALETAEGRHCQARDAGRVMAFLEMLP